MLKDAERSSDSGVVPRNYYSSCRGATYKARRSHVEVVVVQSNTYPMFFTEEPCLACFKGPHLAPKGPSETLVQGFL